MNVRNYKKPADVKVDAVLTVNDNWGFSWVFFFYLPDLDQMLCVKGDITF